MVDLWIRAIPATMILGFLLSILAGAAGVQPPFQHIPAALGVLPALSFMVLIVVGAYYDMARGTIRFLRSRRADDG